ncbi:MAG TPA: phytanoyl-CoA dioxygenase family protein, partial [Microlunatus sp.]|nr:phytanoyl-CoA dioxygenase family protein [Microlunatus sp.]
DAAELRARLQADGYLYLPGYLDVDEVRAARLGILTALQAAGGLAPGTDPDQAVPAPDYRQRSLHEIARDCEPLQRLLYAGRMAEFYHRIFADRVRHFDYTWLRAVPPGKATPPHMDSVFMNRGTLELLTAWTPLGDIDRTLGGVAVLAGSHRLEQVKREYGHRDVDTYCADDERAGELAGQERMVWDGVLTREPAEFGRTHGLRWLTADYRAGDLLTFTIFTVHLGLDNNADRIRLSSDSRYQRAGEEVDPRWIGIDPSAHGSRSKRGMIC